jgi:hypothetical protein
MDDGKREVALSLGLDQTQFDAIDGKLGGIDGAINRLGENVSSVDTSVAAEVSTMRIELGMRLTAINESITTMSENLGKWLAAIALAVANPDDNSAAIQAHIDKLTAEIKQQTDATQAAVNNAKET